MQNVPKEYIVNFFKQTQVLNDEEVKFITDICTFGIEMPALTHDNVLIYINAQKVLPTKIFNKLTSFPNDKLKFIIQMKNDPSDYSELDEYIQS